ncbi:hypothetical protein A9Q78_08460 [Methylophaga sp. 41_12_T18]|nr:hypothetical protein A9Q78_08460 [Methylophaga sp. 41_12_T18]
MTKPQPAIFQENSTKFYSLEYSLDLSLPLATLKSAISKSLSNTSSVSIVIAFGKQAWNKLQPDWQPESLIDFEALQGVDGYSIPSTQRDLFFWIHSENHDDNLDCVLKVQQALAGVAKLQLELPGFTYHDSRDLTGFVDGSANPKGGDQQLAALIPAGQPGEGGSYILTQKWLHDLASFNQLPQDQQEKIIGRTKPDSIELEGDAMPADSHVSRTDVKVDGRAMKIYRRSAPYGSATEQGLYFLSFACEIKRFSIQLERMFGTTDDGLHDRLIEYSTPLTSSYWFAPSQQDLDDLLH